MQIRFKMREEKNPPFSIIGLACKLLQTFLVSIFSCKILFELK